MEIFGHLYDRSDGKEYLSDGMVTINVGRYTIDISWWPEHSPDGFYVMTVFKDGFWENRVEQSMARDLFSVKAFIYFNVMEYYGS